MIALLYDLRAASAIVVGVLIIVHAGDMRHRGIAYALAVTLLATVGMRYYMMPYHHMLEAGHKDAAIDYIGHFDVVIAPLQAAVVVAALYMIGVWTDHNIKRYILVGLAILALIFAIEISTRAIADYWEAQ